VRASVIAFVLVLLLAATASAQTEAAPAPPADGLYEDFSSIFMEAVGPLAAPPTVIPRWVSVATRAGVTTVTFEPERRVVWHITWGAHGPTEKVTLVDGVEWTRSRFSYDASGHLARKEVSGPGAPGGLSYAYETDDAGAVLARTATLPHRVDGPATAERVEVHRGPHGALVSTTHDGAVVRVDRYDASHRLLETRWSDAHGAEVARLRYRRDRHGALASVVRRIGPHRGPADFAHPLDGITSFDVASVRGLPMERHEAWLLLGLPTHATDEERGTGRRVHDDFAPDACWLNQPSMLQFDPALSLEQVSAGCICGFCVAIDAIDPSERDAALGRAHHYTRGPWVRLDAGLAVPLVITAEHEVATPDGWRRADALVAGDRVLGADGTVLTLREVSALDDTPRLGASLRTERGAFSAAGILVRSEAP
jgi:YD repeat-containing protein